MLGLQLLIQSKWKHSYTFKWCSCCIFYLVYSINAYTDETHASPSQGTHTIHSHKGSYRGNKESLLNLMHLILNVGGHLSTQRKPTQTGRTHKLIKEKPRHQILPFCCETNALPTATKCCGFFLGQIFWEEKKKKKWLLMYRCTRAWICSSSMAQICL